MPHLLEEMNLISTKYGLTINKKECKFCINSDDEMKFMGITHTKFKRKETSIAY